MILQSITHTHTLYYIEYIVGHVSFRSVTFLSGGRCDSISIVSNDIDDDDATVTVEYL